MARVSPPKRERRRRGGDDISSESHLGNLKGVMELFVASRYFFLLFPGNSGLEEEKLYAPKIREGRGKSLNFHPVSMSKIRLLFFSFFQEDGSRSEAKYILFSKKSDLLCTRFSVQ